MKLSELASRVSHFNSICTNLIPSLSRFSFLERGNALMAPVNHGGGPSPSIQPIVSALARESQFGHDVVATPSGLQWHGCSGK
jgi:hypothetical protein